MLVKRVLLELKPSQYTAGSLFASLVSSFVVGLGFWERSSNLVAGHFVATNIHFEHIRAGIQLNSVVFFSHEEAQGVERHFKLGRNTNETSSNELLHTFPGEL